jgi:hypothetical protein
MLALVYDVRAARETSKPGGDVAERRRESVTTTPVAGVTLEDILAGGAVVNDAPKARQPFTGAKRFDQQLVVERLVEILSRAVRSARSRTARWRLTFTSSIDSG